MKEGNALPENKWLLKGICMDSQSCSKLVGGNKLWFLALVFFWGEGVVGVIIVYKETSHFNKCFLVAITDVAI